jgi:hypothetical protein
MAVAIATVTPLTKFCQPDGELENQNYLNGWCRIGGAVSNEEEVAGLLRAARELLNEEM